MNSYGVKMLHTLVTSDMAGPGDKGMLDTVWRGTGIEDGRGHRTIPRRGPGGSITKVISAPGNFVVAGVSVRLYGIELTRKAPCMPEPVWT